MKLCGKIHNTPEPGQGPRPFVPHCSGPSPWPSPSPGSAQCEYTIKDKNSKHIKNINNMDAHWLQIHIVTIASNTKPNNK